MSPGPLRRTTAAVGLLSMVPIAVMVLTAALTPQEAAVRAAALVLAVLLVGNLVRIIITQLLHRVERAIPDDAEVDGMPIGGGMPSGRTAGAAGAGGMASGGAGSTDRAGAAGVAAAGPGASGTGAIEDGAPRRRAEDQVDAGRR